MMTLRIQNMSCCFFFWPLTKQNREAFFIFKNRLLARNALIDDWQMIEARRTVKNCCRSLTILHQDWMRTVVDLVFPAVETTSADNAWSLTPS